MSICLGTFGSAHSMEKINLDGKQYRFVPQGPWGNRNLKAEHDGKDPRLFVRPHDTIQTGTGPKLTGVISFELKEGVDAESFIQDYALSIRWVSRLNMVSTVPVDTLNLTKLADIERFFELANQLEASKDVMWVQKGRADHNLKPK